MSKPYDATLKDLIELSPADWVAFLGRPMPRERVCVIDADLSSVTTAADKVIRVDDQQTWLLHLEIQSTGDPNLELRLLKYHALLRERHKLPVATVVVLLREGSGETKLTGRTVLKAPVGPDWEFGYSIIEVRKQPPERFLNAGRVLLALAPISAVEEAELPGVIAEMKQRLQNEPDKALRAQIWADAFILLGLRYSEAVAQRLLQEVIAMEESTTYQAILRKGRAEGNVEGAAHMLLLQGSARFHSPPPARIENAINSIKDLTKLEQLGLRIIEVNSWDDLIPSA